MGRTLPKLIEENFTTFCFIVFVFAVLLRVIFIPNRGFEADISFWKSWGLATLDYGIVEGIRQTNNNYPTPFAYTLGILVWIYSWFADPHIFHQFWSNTNTLFLTIAKMPAILADFGIAGIIWVVGMKPKQYSFPALPRVFTFFMVCFYLLNPLSIIDGAWWGQVDSVGVFVFILAVLAAIKDKPMLAGFIYVVAMMTKLQNMIYGPIFFILLWQLSGFSGLLKAISGAAGGFMLLNFEFFQAREMGRVIGSLTDNYDYFPLMSLNAYNPWWIFSQGAGMKMSDKYIAWGITNAKTFGLFLFSSCYLFAVFHQITPAILRIFSGKGISVTPPERSEALENFFGSLVVANGAFFLFQTQSHDRYAFPISVFLLLWGYFRLSRNLTKTGKDTLLQTKSFSRFSVWYAIFSLVYFYNLHTALVANYPDNGLPILNQLTSTVFTIPVAYMLTGLYVLYLFILKNQARLSTYVIPTLFFFILLGSSNAPLFFKKPVYVSNLTPIASAQDYATRQKDMPSEAYRGFTAWQPLSVQYYFYHKGIGTHAKSYNIYDINKQFSQLTTDYGIATTASDRGTGIFEIYGDDKLLFRSEKMGRFDLPKHAQIDLTNIQKLSLVTSDAGDGINDDHTVWLNTKLWPK